MEKVPFSTVFRGFSVGLLLGFLGFGCHFWVKKPYVAKYWHWYNKMTHRTEQPFFGVFFSAWGYRRVIGQKWPYRSPHISKIMHSSINCKCSIKTCSISIFQIPFVDETFLPQTRFNIEIFVSHEKYGHCRSDERRRSSDNCPISLRYPIFSEWPLHKSDLVGGQENKCGTHPEIFFSIKTVVRGW